MGNHRDGGDRAVVRAILELARWAPSGDNTQPWRFELVAPDRVVVHGFDTRADCVYDLDGHSSQLAIGALLESMRIAASGHGFAARVARRADAPETKPTFDVHFVADSLVRRSPLIGCLATRSVQRRPLGTRALTPEEKKALDASVADSYRVHWLEGAAPKWRAARLLWLNAGLRLTLPEAYEVHRRIIEWNARYSEDRIPDQALGASALTLRLMRYALQSWRRMQFVNTWLGGRLGARLELDLVPALACGAHFLIAAGRAPAGIDDYIAGGAAMQRFWLTATSLGLQLQPQMTPLIFARYANERRRFSALANAEAIAQDLAGRLAALWGSEPASCAIFMGRIGAGPMAHARSVRLPLEALVVDG